MKKTTNKGQGSCISFKKKLEFIFIIHTDIFCDHCYESSLHKEYFTLQTLFLKYPPIILKHHLKAI